MFYDFYRLLLYSCVCQLLIKFMMMMKETSWSCRQCLNPTSTTPSCYNNTTLGNRLYAQGKGSNVTNPISWTCKNCSYECAADCEHCVTQPSTEQFWQYSPI